MLISKRKVLPLHFSPDVSAVPLTGEPEEDYKCERRVPSLFQSHLLHEDTGIYYVCQTEPGATALRGQGEGFIIRIKVIASMW